MLELFGNWLFERPESKFILEQSASAISKYLRELTEDLIATVESNKTN